MTSRKSSVAAKRTKNSTDTSGARKNLSPRAQKALKELAKIKRKPLSRASIRRRKLTAKKQDAFKKALREYYGIT